MTAPTNPRDPAASSTQGQARAQAPAQAQAQARAQAKARGRTQPQARVRAWRGFGVALQILALWATVVPYTARPLGLTVATRPIVEVVDHVVPGVVLLVIGAAATIIGRLRLEAALLAVLAALWTTGTHVPLLFQAARGGAAWAAALFHSLPGITLLALTVGASLGAWREAA